jgi:hypothetical protein
MRLILILIALIAIPAPAAADVKARYTGTGGAAVIEVDGNGDVRMGGEGGDSYSLFTAAGDYVVFSQEGALAAARYEDFHAVLDAAAAGSRPSGGETAPPTQAPATPPWLRIGPETVAGYEGTRFEWVEAAVPRNAFAVVSDSPKLRPLGRAMAKLLLQMPSFERTLTGRHPPAVLALVDMLDTSAMLKLDEVFTLAEVSFDELPEERFRLPATLLTRDQLAAWLNRPSTASEAGSAIRPDPPAAE